MFSQVPASSVSFYLCLKPPLWTQPMTALLAAVPCHRFAAQLTWLKKNRRNCHCSFQLLAPAPPGTAALVYALFLFCFPFTEKRRHLKKNRDFQTSSFFQNLLVLFLREINSYLLARHSTNVFLTLYPPSTTHKSVKQTDSASHSHLCKILKKAIYPQTTTLFPAPRFQFALHNMTLLD